MPRMAIRKLVILFALFGGSVAAANSPLAAREDQSHLVDFDVSEVTRMSVDVSADGTRVYLDALDGIYVVDAKGGRARQLSDAAASVIKPTDSPDGASLAFLSDEETGIANIWISNADGSHRRRLTNFASPVISYAWLPGGDQLMALASQGLGPSLFSVSIDGLVVPISPKRGKNVIDEITDLAVNPVTGAIYATALRDTGAAGAPNEADIVRLDVDDGKASFAQIVPGMRPLWLPDGQSFIVARVRDDKISLHLVRNSEEREIAVITSSATPSMTVATKADDSLPGYSATRDGKSLLVSDNGKLTLIDIGSGEKRLVPLVIPVSRSIGSVASHRTIVSPDHPQQLLWPSFDRGGRHMVFSAGRKLWSWRIGEKARILDEANDYQGPVISPDGRRIAVVGGGGSGGTLKILDARGREVALVEKSSDYVSAPTWSRDGLELGYLKFDWDGGAVSYGEARPASLQIYDVEKGRLRSLSLGSLEVDSGLVELSGTTARISSFSYDEVKLSSFDRRSGDTLSRQVYPISPETPSATTVVEPVVYANLQAAIVSPDSSLVALEARDAIYVTPTRLLDKKADIGQVLDHPLSRRLGYSGSQLRWDGGMLSWSAGDKVYSWSPAKGLSTLHVPFSARSESPKRPLAITNVNLVTSAEPFFIPDAMLLIEGGRISFRGRNGERSIPPGAEVLDGEGSFVMPGFIDTHAHPFVGGRTARRGAWYEQDHPALIASLKWGVTTLLDPNAPSRDAFYFRDMVEFGGSRGPRIFSTGDLVASGTAGIGIPWARDADDFRWIIGQRQAAGAQFIKSYLIADRDWRQLVVSEAHRRGMRVVAEGGGWHDHQVTHILDGTDGIEHSFGSALIYDDIAQLLAGARNSYTPLLGSSAYGNYPDGNVILSRLTVKERRHFLGFLPKQKLDWKLRFDANAARGDKDLIFDKARSAFRVAHAGANVSAGSHGDPDGIGVHWDIWMMVNGGFAPEDAINAATINGARKLGIDHDLGSIEVGKLADLVIVAANPLSDIRNTAKIKYVVKGGQVETRPADYPPP